MLDLTHFFMPGSIAMIGATDDAATIRGRILDFLVQRRYSGTLYCIGSHKGRIHGQPVYKSILDVPGQVDLALIAVRADLIEGIIRDCARAGVKFAVCFSSGFAEEGEVGRDMQERLSAIAKTEGIRICGPNTAGFFNVHDMVSATFTRSVDVRRSTSETGRLVSGPVAIVAQSGGLGFALQHRCALQQGLGLSYIVTTGNEVDLEALDFISYILEDDKTRVILLTLEGLKNASRLEAAAARAAELGKVIIVAKFGRTSAGSRAATSHAARMTGSDAVYDAAFRRYGLVRVEDEEEMVDFAAVYTRSPTIRGNRIAIVTTSGGAGVWMADACESAGLQVPLLTEGTQRLLNKYVPSFGSTVNPLDLTAQVSINAGENASGDAGPLIGTLSVLSESEEIDAIVLVANLSDGQVLSREGPRLKSFLNATAKPLLLYSHALPSPQSLELAWEIGLTCLASTRRVARALRHLVDHSNFQIAYPSTGIASKRTSEALRDDKAAPGSSTPLCEYQSKALLREYGIATPQEVLAQSEEHAILTAREMGGSVALKIQSPQIPHKTDVHGVALNIIGEDAVRDAYRTVLSKAKAGAPEADIHGVLLQKMQAKGLEMALGIVQDKDFGPIMMVGFGGVYVEVLNDVVYDLLPVDKPRALSMLERLRGASLFKGIRGEAPYDIDALAAIMEKLSSMVEQNKGWIKEIDLNPVFVYPSGSGVAVIDAMIVQR